MSQDEVVETRDLVTNKGLENSPNGRGGKNIKESVWETGFVVGIFHFLISALSVKLAEVYGAALFILCPVVAGFLAGHVLLRHHPGEIMGAIYSAVIAGCGILLLFFIMGLEGILCILMSLPLYLPASIFGALLAIILSSFFPKIKQIPPVMMMLMVYTPCLMGIYGERAWQLEASVREVKTSITIMADQEKIWQTIIEFPPIEESPTGILAMGIAYPLSATISGKGVGATRHCVFNLGEFVEPITTWDAPNVLAFDVLKSPRPMREWSIYGDIHTPHQHGYMVSKHGRFEVSRLESGEIIVTGTTWYQHRIFPEWYWGPLSDHIIHAVHERVLTHIKRVAEKG